VFPPPLIHSGEEKVLEIDFCKVRIKIGKRAKSVPFTSNLLGSETTTSGISVVLGGTTGLFTGMTDLVCESYNDVSGCVAKSFC